MKRLQPLLFVIIIAASGSFTSCTTTKNGDGAEAGGISASQTGMTREDVYQWQDRTFRQLAY